MHRKRKFRSPPSRLAGYNERGEIWINKRVPRRLRRRLRTHEEVEIGFRNQGMTYKQAHRLALKAEHKGLTRRQIAVYEGELGGIARTSKYR
jgi:hypothetical protein